MCVSETVLSKLVLFCQYEQKNSSNAKTNPLKSNLKISILYASLQVHILACYLLSKSLWYNLVYAEATVCLQFQDLLDQYNNS